MYVLLQFLNKGVHVVKNKKSKGKRVADNFISGCLRVKKKSNFEKIDSCLEMWASSLNARKKKKIQQKLKNIKQNATTAQTDFYSIDSCMNVLEAMENISDAAYINVLEKFKDVDW